ncbi:MAG: tetraacyldisaccharide 4'-kinase [Bacteroidaceae bacterium]|nr:tetraacyldisaccharide 4'-kinase [Bacteroidaceae bacterium]
MLRPLRYLLLPFAWLYGLVVMGRNLLFDAGVLRSRRFPLPVIAVGNLAVGGTGKTPHTEYLLRLLSDFRVAMLSRGYGRRTVGFALATDSGRASDIGDEPAQMHRKFPEVVVAVDENRREGIEILMCEQNHPIEVIVLDDAFQHRYVRAGMNLLLTDYHRRFTHDFLMPVGRLREPASGKKRADIIIVTKCPENLSADEAARIRKEMALQAGQKMFFTTFGYGEAYPLFPQAVPVSEQCLAGKPVLLVTGIAKPVPLRRFLEQTAASVTELAFPDHHNFTTIDLRRMSDALASLPQDAVVVTTEKDAERLVEMSGLDNRLRRCLLVQPITVRFLFGQQEEFNQNILDYVAKDTRNCAVD